MSDSGPAYDRPDVEPDVTVIEVMGEKKLGFEGIKHLEMPEEQKDKIHDTYSNLIIDVDDLKDTFSGADLAWNVGRVLDEHNVEANPDMKLGEIEAYCTLEKLHGRNLEFARYIYRFWPNQEYNPIHSMTALGELATRAHRSNRVEQAQSGYQRLRKHEEPLTKDDVLLWDYVGHDASIEEIALAACEHFEKQSTISSAIKHVVLLLNRPLTSVDTDRLERLVVTEFQK